MAGNELRVWYILQKLLFACGLMQNKATTESAKEDSCGGDTTCESFEVGNIPEEIDNEHQNWKAHGPVWIAKSN